MEFAGCCIAQLGIGIHYKLLVSGWIINGLTAREWQHEAFPMSAYI